MKVRHPFSPLVVALLMFFAIFNPAARGQGLKPMRVMCIGASITMGQGVNGGYRLPLEKMFEGAGISMQFVGRVDSNSKGMTFPFHDGYPGFRIDQVEDGVTGTSQPLADGVRALQPDVALILCGTNDVRQNHDLSEAPQRLDHLIGLIQTAAPQIQILVSSIPPDLHFDDAVRHYNAAVAQFVAKRAAMGQKVRFVDNYAILNPGTDISPDRTHPNSAGYERIARNWFNALEPGAPQIAFALTTEGANSFAGESCLGYKITMKTAAKVTDLGIYCAGLPLTSAHAVGVFDESGHQLAATQITLAQLPSGLFAYQKLNAPLTLQAGKSYFFVSNSVGLPVLSETGAIIDPLFLDNPRFYFDHNIGLKMTDPDGTLLKFPSPDIRDLNGGVGYFGPNFRLAPQ